LAALQAGVREHFATYAADFGLDPSRLQVEYVLSWGSFVNASFRVTDGRVRLHVKLVHEADGHEALRRWRGLHALLEERYHTPPMLGWAAIPGTRFEGPVFAWIDGEAPDHVSPELLGRVLPVVCRLHRDWELAACLAPSVVAGPCLQTYLDTYHQRFVEDLDEVEAQRPPFVSAELLAWMRAEAARLAGLVLASAAFQEPAESPIHGDLWPNNLLVTPEGDWYLLDWDDLTLGDPALDYITLLGPAPGDLRSSRWRELPAGYLSEGVGRERLPLYARATLLDWVIDPLADWVEAEVAPEHAGGVRAEKERVHREALALYGEWYLRPDCVDMSVYLGR
jgi:hypothetical protein